MSRKTRELYSAKGYSRILTRLMSYSVLIGVLGVFAHAASNLQIATNTLVLPTQKVTLNQWPLLQDDLDFAELELVIQRQLDRFKNGAPAGSIKLGSDTYQKSQLVESLLALRDEARTTQLCLKVAQREAVKGASCWQDFQRRMQTRFSLYKPVSSGSSPSQAPGKSLFTAYYTPTLAGRTQASADYPYPIYTMPSDPKLRTVDRVAIDFEGRLAGRGYELFYTKDLFELYLLQIEGGGKVVVSENGKVQAFYLSYQGTNGQSWRFISRYMLQQGMISNSSVEAQREYLDQHPEKWREIYGYCPSYVYFRVTETPPLGSDGVPLTDNRSLATDSSIYRQKGLIAFVRARRPLETLTNNWMRNWTRVGGEIQTTRNFSRFFVDQDTGGAIKGPARADLYFGEGAYAERAAHFLKDYGDMYFLMLNK